MEEQQTKKASRLREVLEWVIALVVAVVVALVLTQVIFVNAQVPSESMEDTIQVGDRIIGYRLSYLNKDPVRGDIAIFRFPDDETQLYIKRIIGMPGDTVEIREGKVYLNGADQPLDEPYVKDTPTGNYGPYQVPENGYFMMGDNRNRSADSRYWNNTFVMRDKIVGKGVLRLFPNPARLS